MPIWNRYSVCQFHVLLNVYLAVLLLLYSIPKAKNEINTFLKSVFLKNVLEKIISPENSQKLPRWNQWIQRGSFCEFLGETIFPSTFFKKTDFNKKISKVSIMVIRNCVFVYFHYELWWIIFWPLCTLFSSFMALFQVVPTSWWLCQKSRALHFFFNCLCFW